MYGVRKIIISSVLECLAFTQRNPSTFHQKFMAYYLCGVLSNEYTMVKNNYNGSLIMHTSKWRKFYIVCLNKHKKSSKLFHQIMNEPARTM
jgi:hypothetical protein